MYDMFNINRSHIKLNFPNNQLYKYIAVTPWVLLLLILPIILTNILNAGLWLVVEYFLQCSINLFTFYFHHQVLWTATTVRQRVQQEDITRYRAADGNDDDDDVIYWLLLLLLLHVFSPSGVCPVASVRLQTSRGQRRLQLHGVRRPWASPHLAEERQTADTQRQRQTHQRKHVRALTREDEEGKLFILTHSIITATSNKVLRVWRKFGHFHHNNVVKRVTSALIHTSAALRVTRRVFCLLIRPQQSSNDAGSTLTLRDHHRVILVFCRRGGRGCLGGDSWYIRHLKAGNLRVN